MQESDKLSFMEAGSTTSTAPPPQVQELQNENSAAPGFLKTARHPTICIFHLLFKVCALAVYCMGWWFPNNQIIIFVITVLFLSFDFWTVKNVTGRLLVGLRWWNDIKDDGTSEWVFESLTDERGISPTDHRVFWWTLYAWPVVWFLFFIVQILSLNLFWTILTLMAIIFACANVYGYWKCSSDAKKKMREWASNQVLGGMASGFLAQFMQGQ
eukprot:Platyproteum_vivax@DN8576_c0_g1_i1.p1